jgi:hypothetical protein
VIGEAPQHGLYHRRDNCDPLAMDLAKPRKKNNGVGAWRIALLIGILPLVLGAMLWTASALSDNGRVPAELAASQQESGVMLCSEGKIVHGAGAFIDSLFDSGSFRCTAWRMRAALVETSTGATHWPSSPRR